MAQRNNLVEYLGEVGRVVKVWYYGDFKTAEVKFADRVQEIMVWDLLVIG